MSDTQQYSCSCLTTDDKQEYQKMVTDCKDCSKECQDTSKYTGNICSSTTPLDPNAIKWIVLIFLILFLFIIGYYVVWFIAFKRVISSVRSSKIGSEKQGLHSGLILLLVIAGLWSFLHPLSGISFLFLLVLLIWFGNNSKLTKISRKR